MHRLTIGLVIERSSDYYRELRRGAADVTRTRPGVVTEVCTDSDPLGWLRRFDGEGVVAQVTRTPIRDYLRRQRRFAAVNVSGWFADPGLPTVAPDNAAIGRAAAAYLLERGYRRFGYVGVLGPSFSDQRGEAFAAAVRGAGHLAREFLADVGAAHDRNRAWDPGLLAEWLAGLPQPTAVLTVGDDRGRTVIRLCRDVEINVPGDLAVLGINNDELICEMCDPPLSSLDPGLRRLGYLATERVLDRIAGRDDGPDLRLLPPGRVVERGSTRASGVQDPVLAAAMRYIDDHAAAGVGVEDVLDHLGVSRRSLELKFCKALDTTPWKAIQLARVRRAEALLTDTELSIARVAELSGFASSYQFSVMFKRRIGVSPTAYRAAGRVHR